MATIYNDSFLPISQLYFGLSPPCGLESDSYVKRKMPIHPLYNEDECRLNVSGISEHTLYFNSGFQLPEYQVLQENDLFDQVQENMFQYNHTELELNNYTLYFKSFAYWKAECQAAYTSDEVELLGLKINSTYKSVYAVFWTSLILVVTNASIVLLKRVIKKYCPEKRKYERGKMWPIILNWAAIIMINI